MDQDKILHLLESYLKQEASEEEKTALARWIEESGEDEQLSVLENAWAGFEMEDPMREDRMQTILEGILGGTSLRKPALYRRGWFRWAAAACIGVLVVGSYWLWRRGEKAVMPVAAPQQWVSEVAPGGNKAILTLGNGSTILLDSAANGTLTEQDNAKVSKQGDGVLAYEGGAAGGRKPGAAGGVSYNTLTTPRGGQYEVRLPDGTRVWLNAASSLTYPTAFTGRSRKVTMTGEAYFEVAPDRQRPFEVGTGGLTVDVLGTHFNINAYTDEAYVGTTLLEGSVKVKTGKAAMVLRPGEQGLTENPAGDRGTAGGIKTAASVNLEQVMAWKNGLFYFNHADIQTIMRQLARWYDVEVEYQGVLPVRDFRGKMQRDLQLSQVLKFLEQSDVHFTLMGKKIIVRP